MDSKRVEIPYDAITYDIIGDAMAIHRVRGRGYKEVTYQRDLEVRFKLMGRDFDPEPRLPVYDSSLGNQLVGFYIPDFIVQKVVVVEIKALWGLDNSHIAQMIGYLAVTGCSVGLLINFGRYSLEWRRIFPPKDILEHRVNRQWLWVPDWLKGAQSAD